MITSGATKINQAVCTKLNPFLCTCSGACYYTPCIGVVFFPINKKSLYYVVPRSHRADHKDAMLAGSHIVETLVLSPGDVLVGHPFLIHAGGPHPVPLVTNGGWTEGVDLNTRGFCFADDKVRILCLTCPFVCRCVCAWTVLLWCQDSLVLALKTLRWGSECRREKGGPTQWFPDCLSSGDQEECVPSATNKSAAQATGDCRATYAKDVPKYWLFTNKDRASKPPSEWAPDFPPSCVSHEDNMDVVKCHWARTELIAHGYKEGTEVGCVPKRGIDIFLRSSRVKELWPEADQIKADADLVKKLGKDEVKLQQMDAKLAASIAANEGKQLGGSQDVSPQAHQAREACDMMRQ